MAQKRNPVSLRLQTRLQGYEKRFASCWFTDLFFSQVYADDLVKRMYLGHLLQKGGSWYGDVSESRIPETCISIQFLYRRCSILSVVLDRRKEEYVSSNLPKGVKSRSEALSSLSRQEGMTPRIAGGTESSGIHVHSNNKSVRISTDDVPNGQVMASERDKLPALSGDIYGASLSPRAERLTKALPSPSSVPIDKMAYLSIANCLESVVAKQKRCVAVLLERPHDNLAGRLVKTKSSPSATAFGEKQTSRLSCFASILAPQRDCTDWLNDWRIYQKDKMIPDSAYLFAIESICNSSRRDQERIAPSFLIDVQRGSYSEPDLLPLGTGKALTDLGSDQMVGQKEGLITPLIPGCHWTSCNFVRGVSAYQNIEFCLYSVAFLYKKRLSFLQIKETLFTMLAANGSVRGARLVCSGRQGGRSKSAMRAKKQSALWGQTALSLFSSRLAFASTGVDTSFGQIGIKIWICYK